MIDFLVIGGGIAGVSAAARLSDLGHVVLLEAEDALAYELPSELFTDYARKQRMLRVTVGSSISLSDAAEKSTSSCAPNSSRRSCAPTARAVSPSSSVRWVTGIPADHGAIRDNQTGCRRSCV